jgi:catechol 2,3-dioxygenase-like lactoylglutathione lyase family enzyme
VGQPSGLPESIRERVRDECNEGIRAGTIVEAEAVKQEGPRDHPEPYTMPAPPIQCLVETAVYAEDLDRAEKFYRDVLGLAVDAKELGRHVFFKVGDAGVLLVFRAQATLKGDRLPAHGAHGPGHFAMGIARDDLDAWRNRLLGHGVAIEHEEHWPLGGQSLYFRDPAGNSVELITPGVWGLPAGW